MPLYLTLEPISYIDGVGVTHGVSAGRIVQLTAAQAAELPGSVVYYGSGVNLQAPRVTVLTYDSNLLFPNQGSRFHLYVAEDTGLLYRWSESGDDYSLVSINSEGIADATDVGLGLITAEDEEAARDVILAVGRNELVFNVKDYGAMGDGVTDDTVAIQAAIDASGSEDGTETYGIVFFPAGDYVVKSTIFLKANLRIMGVGEGTFLDFTNPTTSGDNLFEWVSSDIDDVVIEHMRIRGESLDAGDGSLNGVAIKLSSTGNIERFRARKLRIERFRYGIFLRSSEKVEAPEVSKCWVDECSYAGITISNSRDALIISNTVDCDRSSDGDIGDGVAGKVGIWCSEMGSGSLGHTDAGVHNNHVYSASAEGINVHGKYVSITGNNVRDCPQTGIVFEPFITTSPSDEDAKAFSVISGNVVRGSDSNISVRHDPINNTRSAGRVAITGNSTYLGTSGIRVGVSGASTSGPLDVVVSGNICMEHTYGIYVISGERITIDGNTAVGCTARAVRLDGTSKAISLSGGVYNAVGTNAQALGIEPTVSLVSIVGGVFNATGSNADGIGIGGTYITISGATVYNCDRSGVRISGAANHIIINGLIGRDDQGSPTMDNAVQVTSSGTDIVIDGHPIAAGTIGSPFSGSGIRSLNGIGTESANAETPTAASWQPGDTITFTDSGDGSGSGIYKLSRDGSTWIHYYVTGGTDVAVADGGTGASTASNARTNLGLADMATASTASTIAQRDSNANLLADAFIPSFTSTVTNGTTTTLTVDSTEVQEFTGSTASHVCQLPTTGVVKGQGFRIVNSSTITLAVTASGGGGVATVPTTQAVRVVALVDTPTTAAHWSANNSWNKTFRENSVTSSVACRDANANLFSDNFIATRTQTTSAAGTLTMNIDSAQVQEITGTSTHTVKLPTTSVVTGQEYVIVNNSTGNVTVQSSGANTIVTLPGSSVGMFVAQTDTPTTAAGWSAYVTTAGKALTTSNSLTLAGTDGTIMTFPSTNATIARTDASNTFTGVQTFSSAPSLGALPTGAGVASAATASTLAARDSNANLFADNFIASNASTTTAAGILTMTIDSAQVQVFTGSTTHTCKLPTTSVVAGQAYTVINQSSGAISVQASDASTVYTQTATRMFIYTARIDTPVTASDWQVTGLTATGGASANALAIRDANANLFADVYVRTRTQTASSGGTLALSMNSAQVQEITGSTTHTVQLPTSNVSTGQEFVIVNNSTGNVTVQSSGANTISTLTTVQMGVYKAQKDAPTAAADWKVIFAA